MNLFEIIKAHPIIPVFYHDDIQICESVLKACYDGGVRVFEFVNRGEKAFENFQKLQKFRDQNYPDLKLGIGTIKTAAQAEQFLKAQTDFLVSPIFISKIGEVAKANRTPWIPGCMTPTEVSWAIEAGCPLVKIFPGNIVGPGFIKALKAVFPEVELMPTGGVQLTSESLNKWFSAGVFAVGIGSSLFKNPGNLSEIKRQLKEGFRIIKERIP